MSHPSLPKPPYDDHATPALCLLEDQGVLAVSGPDAAKFLQGQVTCDVNALAIGASVGGARCTPKGRMQASFRLLRQDEHSYLLGMPAERVSALQAELSRYAVFFKVKLEDASAQWIRLGLLGELQPLLTQLPQDHGALAVQDNAGLPELWLPQEAATSADTLTRLSECCASASPERWQLARIRGGFAEVCADTSEHFIPQMFNLQVLGAISFRKGCYTGQEIVARMQYLGKLKRRLYRFALSQGPCPAPGEDIVDADGKVIGEVANAASHAGSLEMLAVVQTDAAQSAALSLCQHPQTQLQLLPLPQDAQLAAALQQQQEEKNP